MKYRNVRFDMHRVAARDAVTGARTFCVFETPRGTWFRLWPFPWQFTRKQKEAA